MDHWFDRLTQPHSRRTMLKAGAFATVALVLPSVRAPKAWALTGEPCYKPCVDAAAAAASKTKNTLCKAEASPYFFGLLVAFGAPEGALLMYRGINDFLGCLSNAELKWHEAVEACRGSECGDRATYPGGQAPGKAQPKCTPGHEVVCGSGCCDIVATCCPCASADGGYICCAANSNCDCCPSG